MRTVAAAVLLAFALAPCARAADRVDDLIRELSSDDYRTREKATQGLAELGDSALPRLQDALPKVTDGETRSRLQAAIEQINESRAAGETFLTLDFTNADAKVVLEEVSRQARATVAVLPAVLPTLPKVTFKCEHESFWPALRRLCAPLGLQPEALANGTAMNPFIRRVGGGGFGGGGGAAQQPVDHALTLTKVGAPWDKVPTSFTGPFMICVQQVSDSGVVLPATGQRTHNLVVQCVVIAEPKLTVVGRSATARVTDPPAVAPGQPGAGNIVPGFFNPRVPFAGRAYYNPTGACVWPVLIPLARPADAKDTLPHLKAIANARLMVRSETWEVPDIAHAAPRTYTLAGRTFTIKSVGRQGDTVEVVASASRRADAVDGDDQTFAGLQLLDGEDRPLTPRVRNPRGITPDDPTGLSYSILFEGTADGAPIVPTVTPLKLRWRLPLDMKDVELPLEFSDLPLP